MELVEYSQYSAPFAHTLTSGATWRLPMKYMTTAFLTLLLGLTTGCGSSSDKEKEPAGPDESAGLLVIVENPGVLEASLKSAFTTINSSNLAQAGPGVPAPAPADSSSFTGTYTQEVNVDEFDAVRYDGSHLFVAPRKYLQCCFLATPTAGASSSDERPERSIRILSTDPASGTATLAGTIPLEDGISVQGMYLAGESMFALTGESLYGTFGGGWADFAIWAPEQLGYRVYDVADKANPVMQVDATIDGIFVDSRRIGDTVYIISRYSPYIDELIYYVTTEEERLQNEQTLASVSLDDMLPKITVNGVKRNLVTPENCFVTDNDEAAGYPVLTSITAISVDDPTSFSTTCYNEEAYGVYVSDSALYLTEILTTNDFSDQTTRIHKFSLSNTQVNYRGSADIDGVAWSGGQADFRISEHNGDLRVLSTSYDSSDEDFVDHHLYVLRESASEPSLEVVATLPNDQRPEEIGKPNEALVCVCAPEIT